MKRLRQPFFVLVLAACVAFAACGAGDRTESLPVHLSPIAGTWYPATPDALRTQLGKFFDAVPTRPDAATSGTLLAVISPHAGYAYSGPTAAHAYSALAARKPAPRRIIILGPTHSVAFDGVSIGRYSAYRTPLGDAPLDLEAIATLRRCPVVQAIPAAHQREHSVDIQVPLLQYSFGDKMPRIVPIVIGRMSDAQVTQLAEALRDVIDERTVVVISSDFTHYGPRFGYTPFADKILANLRAQNDRAAAAILTGRRERFAEYLRETSDTICGRDAIQELLELLPDDAKGSTLHYATSTDTTGDTSSVVVYRAMEFRRPGGWPLAARHGGESLSDAAKTALLELARQSMNAAVRGQAPPDGAKYQAMPELTRKRAAFVTLTEHGQLRGCIGSIFPQEALWESVRRHARNAALDDPRFPPVGPDEAGKLHIEISVLTVPHRVASWRDVHIGADGVVLSLDGRRAVYLPQVAPEQGWTLEETLTHLSTKAGLPRMAWKDPNCQFLTYQATVFEEKESATREAEKE